MFDAHSEIGGQFNIAKQIPGKEEFYETLRYYRRMIEVTGVTLKLNHTVTADQLQAFDETILASGIRAAHSAHRRDRSSEGIELSRCTARQSAGWQQSCHHRLWRDGFDTAMYLSQPGESTSQNIAGFCNEWGIDSSLQQAGGLSPQGMQIPRSPRQIVMLQRKASKPGQGLGKTTGWIHRNHPAFAGCENDPRRKLSKD
ncbi:2,4-dienoyl-CoA reductase [Escherichia coli]|uniref:2,4-dienoyl-CoA reductase n=1 Tax=Escherichia coli TaxID=562 RepID=A0A377A9Y0_ECOLX|nr:2,4-dienoyl-CoA reductase [Escherichia coli]